MHLVLRNQLDPQLAARSIRVQVVDSTGRSTRAGAEVRVYAAGTRQLLATRLLDTGSGYNAQNDMPVQIGLPESGAIDIEVAWPANGRRMMSVIRNARVGSTFVVRTGR
jgi:hypothetical protein